MKIAVLIGQSRPIAKDSVANKSLIYFLEIISSTISLRIESFLSDEYQYLFLLEKQENDIQEGLNILDNFQQFTNNLLHSYRPYKFYHQIYKGTEYRAQLSTNCENINAMAGNISLSLRNKAS